MTCKLQLMEDGSYRVSLGKFAFAIHRQAFSGDWYVFGLMNNLVVSIRYRGTEDLSASLNWAMQTLKEEKAAFDGRGVGTPQLA
jgi:hypothetical protein